MVKNNEINKLNSTSGTFAATHCCSMCSVFAFIKNSIECFRWYNIIKFVLISFKVKFLIHLLLELIIVNSDFLCSIFVSPFECLSSIFFRECIHMRQVFSGWVDSIINNFKVFSNLSENISFSLFKSIISNRPLFI